MLSMIATQPMRTLSHVFGLIARSPCRIVTRVTAPSSVAGANVHSTRLGGSSAISASYSACHVYTSREGGSNTSIVPSTASRSCSTIRLT